MKFDNGEPMFWGTAMFHRDRVQVGKGNRRRSRTSFSEFGYRSRASTKSLERVALASPPESRGDNAQDNSEEA